MKGQSLSTNYEMYRSIYESDKSKMKSENEIISDLVGVYLEDHPTANERNAYDVAEKMFNKFEQEELIVSLFKKGLSQKEVNEETGLGANKIRRAAVYAKTIGVKVPRIAGAGISRGGLMSKKDEVLKMLLEGKSNTEISDALGIYRGNVSQYRNKLRNEDIAKHGTTLIPSGYEVAQEVVYTRPVGRPTVERTTSMDYLVNNLSLTEGEAKEYIEKYNSLTNREKERMELDLETFCNIRINSGDELETIYAESHNKDWYSKVHMTMNYLEILKYGATLDSFKKDSDIEDMVYILKDNMIGYKYEDNDADGFIRKEHYRELTKEVAELLLDKNGEPKKLLYEGVMGAINEYIKTGVLKEPSRNWFIRRITYKGGLGERLKKFAS